MALRCPFSYLQAAVSLSAGDVVRRCVEATNFARFKTCLWDEHDAIVVKSLQTLVMQFDRMEFHICRVFPAESWIVRAKSARESEPPAMANLVVGVVRQSL